jgi:glycosyltransferase involved in cell wall biosynthesis
MAEGKNLIRQDERMDDEFKWVIGHIARFHPKKDHVTFFEAARLVLNQRSDVLFLAVGRRIERSNAELWEMIQTLKLEKNVRLLGETENISDIYSSLNMLVSSSCWGEGFPNVIAEAMASGIVCVGTDVGETAHVIGSTGAVVSPRDPVALAAAILEQLSLPLEIKRAMSLEVRSRISGLFSLEKISQEYLSIYRLHA